MKSQFCCKNLKVRKIYGGIHMYCLYECTEVCITALALASVRHEENSKLIYFPSFSKRAPEIESSNASSF